MPAILSTKLRRVARFFGITDQEYAYWLGQVIHPVFDIAPYVKNLQLVTATVAVGGVGLVNVLTVPLGRRWAIFGYRLVKATGTFTFSSGNIFDTLSTLPLPATPGSVTDFVSWLYTPVVFASGWSLSAYIDVLSAAGTLTGLAYIQEEDA